MLVTEFYVDDIFACFFVNNLDKKFFFYFDLNFLLKSKNVFLWNEKRLIETLDKGDLAIDFRRGIESLIQRRPRIVSSCNRIISV